MAVLCVTRGRSMGLGMVGLVLVMLAALMGSAVSEESTTIELHGSGTTNPSKFLWKMMDTMEVESKLPLLMTYRAVGSGVGMSEFVGKESAEGMSEYQSYSHFGCADVPLTSVHYNTLSSSTSTTKEMVHIPFALGAIGIFHSVPFENLVLNPCLLSKIFQAKITTWDHPAILALNPGLVVPAGQQIKVVRRTKGSSSTAGTTEYLFTANEIDADDTCKWMQTTGTTSNWSAETTNASPDGSSGVAKFIQETEYAIGYLDSGHGNDMNFNEVALVNAAGKSLTSKQAGLAGISAAGETAVFPPVATADFSGVNVYNQDGDNTWPISTMSYFFVRKNLTALGSSGPLLKAFIEYINSDAGQEVVQEFKFAPIPQAIQLYNTATLATLTLDPTVDHPWTFESGTQEYDGMGDHVISSKRSTFAGYERGLMKDDISTLQTSVALLNGRAAHELHGSGTTNPSKYFWKVMDMMEEQAKLPLFMTYRAVGSGTGQKEFVGKAEDGNLPYNHFGSGDIPLTKEYYDEVTATGAEMVHIPFIIGAISFFHSIPTSDQPAGGVHLTACLLSKIFQRRITTWDDPEIMAENPELKVPAGQAITVVHRGLGSSSTAGTTEYLHEATKDSVDECKWDLEVGKLITWPGETISQAGSDGVANHLESNAYHIGYLDAGHGRKLKLGEVALKNKGGKYLKSGDANIGDAAAKAIELAIIPPSGSADFSGVHLYDQDGADTWPITMFSYFYLRKDLTSLGDSGTLLKAFIQYTLSPEGQNMVEEFGFSKVPQEVLDLNARSLNSLITDASAPAWVFEEGGDSPDAYIGAGEHVLSGKRRAYAEYERTALLKRIDELEKKLVIQDGNLKAVEKQYSTSEVKTADMVKDNDDDDGNNKDANGAIAAVGLVFALMAMLLSLYNTFIACRSSNTGGCASAAPCIDGTPHTKLDEEAV